MKKTQKIVLFVSCFALVIVACTVGFILGKSSAKSEDTETTAYENIAKNTIPTKAPATASANEKVTIPAGVQDVLDGLDLDFRPSTMPATEKSTEAAKTTKAPATTADVIDEIRDEIIKHVDLKNKSCDDAILELLALGLKSENIKFRSEDGTWIINPSNWKVIDYEIEGGGDLTRASVVHLICEKPQAVIAMPDVRGMTLDKAKSKLKKAGFKNIDYSSNNGKSVIMESNWTVITQNLKPDSEHVASTQIRLTVAKVAAIPNVVGLPLDKAIKKLENAGFTDITYDSDNGKMIIKKSNWTVTKQNYPSGELVVLDDQIRLTVTK